MRFRLWIAAMLVWWLVLFNLDRLHEGPRISPLVYLLCGSVAIAIVSFPRLLYGSRILMAGAVIAAYGLLKLGLGESVVGVYLPVAAAELCVLGITLIFARKIAWNVLRFEEAAVDMMKAQFADAVLPFEEGQGEMYREIRRARQFERPLALVTLTPSDSSDSASIHRLLQQVQRDTLQRYVDAQVADLLSQETGDCDVIAHARKHFVVLLTESNRDRAEEVARRLRDRVKDELGLALKTGIATFPDEEVTFSGLLERSEADMIGGRESSEETRTLEQVEA